jgi:hypothetical protein
MSSKMITACLLMLQSAAAATEEQETSSVQAVVSFGFKTAAMTAVFVGMAPLASAVRREFMYHHTRRPTPGVQSIAAWRKKSVLRVSRAPEKLEKKRVSFGLQLNQVLKYDVTDDEARQEL